MKKLIKALALLIVILIVAAVGLVFYIDTIAKAAIERTGTNAFGVTTTVGGADVRILTGGVGVSNVDIANPDGFKTDHFMALGEGDLKVSIGTLRKDIVEAPHLILEGLDVNLERSGAAANFKKILENLRGDSSKEDSEGKKYVIHELVLRDIMVHVDLIGAGDVSKLDVPIDEIVLKNVGSAGQGVPLGQLSKIIVQAVLTAIADKAGDLIPPDMLNDLTSQLAQLQDLDQLGIEVTSKMTAEVGKLKQEADELLKGVDDLKNLGDEAKERLKEAGEDLKNLGGDGIGGIIGGGKKDG